MIVLNTNSWHHRLAVLYCNLNRQYNDGDVVNLCTYLRDVLHGAFNAVVLTGLISLFAWPLVAAWEWMVIGFVFGAYSPLDAPVLLASFMIGAAVIIAIFIACDMAHTKYRIQHPKVTKSNPGFGTALYRKWRDKTCFNVKFSG